MISIPAFNRTLVLLSAMLAMSAAWGFYRIPGANLLIVVFTFLTSAWVVDIPSFQHRLLWTGVLAFYAACAQFLTAVFHGLALVQIIVLTIFSYITFSTLPDMRAGCIVMMIGYLSFFAPHGFLPAADRGIDILLSSAIIMLITTLCNINNKSKGAKFCSCSRRKSLVIAAELGTGNLLFQMLHLKQGAWIMLTILFITMADTPKTSAKILALQRIFAVPVGITAGGFFLETFCQTDYRFVYLVPVLGAAGFFLLYNDNNFFLFSLFFMITLTVFSDWLTGPYHQFHFLNTLLSRTISSFIGAIVVMIPLFVNFSDKRRWT